nr:YdiU family protein [Phenylobacterium sp.]
MPVSSAYRPDPRLPDLGPEFADPVAAADFPQTLLRFRNDRAAATVGLDTLTDAEWVAHFGRFQPLPGNLETPLAQRYHGHQFRVYNPDLGDGRGFTFAQLREVGTDRLLDLGTKGSGTTPWSRAGDGRLTLKGGVREVLATAMLEALGVPTSRSFSLIETGEALERGDEPSPTRSAVLTRLSHSHIRFGTFQRQAFLEQPHEIVRLVDYVIETYYPELDKAPDRTSALLTAVVERAGTLAASWMAAGFVHGVLNTDNMNITGESFDYGPYRFLPHNDPNFVAAYFDSQGLYSFGRQPEAVFWNLQN